MHYYYHLIYWFIGLGSGKVRVYDYCIKRGSGGVEVLDRFVGVIVGDIFAEDICIRTSRYC